MSSQLRDRMSEETLDAAQWDFRHQFLYLNNPGHKPWGRLGQLVLLSTLSSIGTLGNIFAIAAVMTEDALKKKGNVLLVNLMLAGLLVTAGSLPANIIALLAGWSPPTPVCHTSWALTCLAAHTALATLPCLAMENHSRKKGNSLPAAGLATLIGITWGIALTITAVQWAGGMSPDHCGEPQTAHSATFNAFTATIGVALVLAPLLLAIIIHAQILLVSNDQQGRRPISSNTATPNEGINALSHVPPPPPPYSLALSATNLAVTAVAGSCWAIGIAADWWAPSHYRNSLMWLPTAAATGSSFIYGVYKPFREAYIQLFHYCCCKTSVSLSRHGRSDTSMITTHTMYNSPCRPASDVRVHIIPGYNMYTTAANRDRHTLREYHGRLKPPKLKDTRRTKSSPKKDVYEL